MHRRVLFLLFLILVVKIPAQNVERIEVSGKVIVETDEKEGISVYNMSANKGTITDVNGDFKIKAALNDIIEFSALQFKNFSVTITDEVIASKQITVILVEEVNKLDEVVLIPFGLTGNLNADLDNVRTYNVNLDDIYFGLDHITDFEFSADYKTKADNLAFNEYNPSVENMLDVVNLAGFLISQVADIDDSKPKTNQEKIISISPFKKALDKYSFNYINSNFNIPLDEVDAFIDYVEVQGVDENLLKMDKELDFLERITQLSKSFLKMKSEKE